MTSDLVYDATDVILANVEDYCFHDDDDVWYDGCYVSDYSIVRNCSGEDFEW